ncbi:sugar transferase [uncultured Paraglaciecola sp.]|uniref:sugar transferase n=1 Tax=uncultured Paraglaciecola sp. TaxID=1765024 RepID=UPI0030DA3494|tara:strand:- start:10523 stop:11128 length:606 start_codon:yes stop_codon:yes gene_type:complete
MLKRLLDIVMSVIALVVFSPFLLILAFLVRIKLGAPILYSQARPGMNNRIFTMLKFRSMTDDKDDQGNLLPDAERLPAFGRLLRSSSLDELPGLLNVLRGDMSIVGPRPLLVEYLSLYNDQQIRRHEMRPGITGWAQVNGRNALSWEQKFKYDLWYVDNQSIWLDLKIICMTVIKVFRRDGINQDGQATVDKFTGTTSGEQ